MNYDEKLEAVEKKIEALENSEEYKELANKNKAWVVPKPTDAEKGEWLILTVKLAELKKKEAFWEQAILTSNTAQVRKTDTVRKGYKKETAAKTERQALTEVADYLYSLYHFPTKFNNPSFGDAISALGFHNSSLIQTYFQKPTPNTVYTKRTGIQGLMEDVYSPQEWDYLVQLNNHVNINLHSGLPKQADGKKVIILDSLFYKPSIMESVMMKSKVVVSKTELDIKDAKSDSSFSE